MNTACSYQNQMEIDPVEMEKYRSDFPFLKNSDVIFFDSSTTSLKPKCVIDAVTEYYTSYPANVKRGTYAIAIQATKALETARKKVADFLGVKKDEIFFTSGATESSNIIAQNFKLDEGDEILLCMEDHRSTITPWLKQLNNLSNVTLKEILIDNEGDYKEEDLFSKITEKTKLVVLTHIHSRYGLEMGIDEIIPQIRSKNPNTKIILDCSQSIGHIDVNLGKLNPDFAYFSGHKVFAETGVGVLYVKKEMQPIFNNIDGKLLLESGTPNISGIISLAAAVDYINQIGLQKIEGYIHFLTRYLYEQLKQLPEIEFSKGIDRCSCSVGYGIVSFKIIGLNCIDVGEIFNDYNFCLRVSNFCSVNSNSEDFIRVSLQLYNTRAEIDKFIKLVQYIISDSKGN